MTVVVGSSPAPPKNDVRFSLRIPNTLWLVRYLAARPRTYQEIQRASGCDRRTAIRWISAMRLAVSPDHWREFRRPTEDAVAHHHPKQFQIAGIDTGWIDLLLGTRPWRQRGLGG